MFYPEDTNKGLWDVFITMVLLWTCVVTPARIAFDQDDDVEIGWEVTRWVVDFMFLVDIFINFNSALEDEDCITIDDRKDIAIEYLLGWFWIDVFSIIPFAELAQLGQKKGEEGELNDINGLARVAKIGRLYKLVKLTKLLRVLKIIKEKNKLIKYLGKLLPGG